MLVAFYHGGELEIKGWNVPFGVCDAIFDSKGDIRLGQWPHYLGSEGDKVHPIVLPKRDGSPVPDDPFRGVFQNFPHLSNLFPDERTLYETRGIGPPVYILEFYQLGCQVIWKIDELPA